MKPFATLDGARTAIRRLRKKGLPTGGVTVWVHGGLYLLDAGLSFQTEDSGEADKPIVYRAVAGEHPRLFGGVRLESSNFVPVTDPGLLARMAPEARGHVVQIRLKTPVARPARYPDIFKGNGGMVQLIRNGAIMPLSRWPNASYTTMAVVKESGIAPRAGGTFIYRDEVVSHAERWAATAKTGDLWLTGFWRVPFETESVRVARVDVQEKAITLAASVPNGIGSKYGPMVNGTRLGDGKEQYFAFNLLEEIDSPGEWSYDFRTNTIFFWPPASDVAEMLLANLAKPVFLLQTTRYLSLLGLEVEGGLQQAILIEGGDHDLVAGCTIRNTGGGGIDVEGGAFNTIQSNDLEDLGTYGIRLVSGDRVTLTPGNLVANNNHIWRYGEQERITQGIYLGGVGNRATHNLIHDGTYHGIEYYGNDQRMDLNEIHHVGLDAGDMGVFYTSGDWAALGNVIIYNFAHDSPNANGSYLDDGASGRTTFGNVFYKLSVGPFLGGGHDNVIENNLIIDCKIGIHIDDRGIARHYDASAHHLTGFLSTIDRAKPPWSTRYGNFLAGIVQDPTRPTGNVFRYNVILGGGARYQLPNPEILNPAQNPFFAGDAKFKDSAHLDFTLASDSPLFSAVPGLMPIPFSQIGLKIDAYRKKLPTAEETGRISDRRSKLSFDSNTDVKASDKLSKTGP